MTVQEEIARVYDSYRRALLDGNGEQAAEVVDHASVEHFECLRNQALRLEADAVKLLPISEALVVLLVRMRYAPEDLEALDGRSLMAQAVTRGWIGREGATRIDVGECHVAGDHAAARVIHDGKPTAMRLRFSYEDEAWRLRLDEMMAMAEQSLVMMGTQSGLSAVETVEAVLGQQAPGVDVSALWDPPLSSG